MTELRPLYLVHGDDHGAVSARRASLRALAQREDGPDRVEALEGEQATPAGVAATLASMTLALGRRVILVDGVERWKQAEVEQQLLPALAAMPPDTVLAMFAREERGARARGAQAPASLHQAVKAAGGQVSEQASVKPWELPGWVRAQGARVGLELDMAAARALVEQVGERPQRLLRELEKLALELPLPGDVADRGRTGGERGDAGGERGDAGGERGGLAARRVSAQLVEQRAAHSSLAQAYTLADALVAGDREGATRAYLRLQGQGERLAGMTYLIGSRLRQALEVAQRLGAGESQAEVGGALGRMPKSAKQALLSAAARVGPERLQAALALLSDLELDTRGGSPLRASRSRISGLDGEARELCAIEAITADAVG